MTAIQDSATKTPPRQERGFPVRRFATKKRTRRPAFGVTETLRCLDAGVEARKQPERGGQEHFSITITSTVRYGGLSTSTGIFMLFPRPRARTRSRARARARARESSDHAATADQQPQAAVSPLGALPGRVDYEHEYRPPGRTEHEHDENQSHPSSLALVLVLVLVLVPEPELVHS